VTSRDRKNPLPSGVSRLRSGWKAALGRLRPRTVRWRLTLLYGGLLVAAGGLLLGLTYALVANSLTSTAARGPLQAPTRAVVKLCGAKALQGGKIPVSSPQVKGAYEKCLRAYEVGNRAGAADQRAHTLDELLTFSLIGLGVTVIVSGIAGWWLAGRVMRPVSAITATARRASEQHLGERVSLAGPRDELKELADTFDEMLDRLDAAFSSQRAFVANASHELRTPLTAMRTAIEVTLAKPAASNEQLRAMAEKVRGGVERAEQLVEALLTLARSEARSLVREPVDLAVVVEDALDASAGAARQRSLNVEASLEPAELAGDRVLLDRLVGNLIDNAVRHGDDGGAIWISTGRDSSAVRLHIANTGPLLDEELVPCLFEPFRRARARVGPDGSGLGLAIVRAVALAHDGSVEAVARPQGGLGVDVVLPVSG
jgi:signal transduction histidine kinase